MIHVDAWRYTYVLTCEMRTPQIDPNYSDLRSSDSGTSTTSWSVNVSFTTPGLSHFDVKSVSHRMPHV